MKITVAIDQGALARKAAADDKRDAMRNGVVRRAHTFRASKGKGSYRRRPKHTTREF